METKTFDVSKAAAMLGIPRRTLGQWVEQGVIEPYYRSGIRRVPVLLSEKNLREASVIIGLRKAGLSMQHLTRAAKYLREAKGHNPYSSGEFLLITRQGRKEVFKLSTEGEVIDLNRQALEDHERGQLSLFPLVHVRLELDRIERVLGNLLP